MMCSYRCFVSSYAHRTLFLEISTLLHLIIESVCVAKLHVYSVAVNILFRIPRFALGLTTMGPR
jgi:hypothetical protein